ncbi:MAG: TRAP transporter small permease subunit, partial [Thiotrichaceae bacterium]|nr:TRAP transporter small permease subunit [Thiotrichaceae bacterium]
YLIVVATFVGISHLARIDKHIKVPALLDYSSYKIKKILAILISSITSLTFFWLSFIAFRYMLSTISSGRVSPVLSIPIYLVVGLVTMGIFLAAVQYLIIFILNLTKKEIYLGRNPESNNK